MSSSCPGWPLGRWVYDQLPELREKIPFFDLRRTSHLSHLCSHRAQRENSLKHRERERLREEAKLLVASATAKERTRGTVREDEARASGAAEAVAAAATAAEDNRQAADEEREEALTAASERSANEAAAARLVEQDARRCKDEEVVRSRVKLEKELAAARERAVKLEGGKWQRASEEAEARAAAEQVVTRVG